MSADAAMRAVLELHAPTTDHYKNRPDLSVCSHCTSGGDPYCYPDEAESFPCLTVRVLEAAFGSGGEV